MKSIVFLLCLFFAHYSKAEVSYFFGTMSINNEIKLDDYESIKNILKNGIDRVNVTSFGGSAMGALKITDILIDAKKPVRIKKYCISACAVMIALIKKNIYVDDDSFMAFHDGYESEYLQVRDFLITYSAPAESMQESLNSFKNLVTSTDLYVVEYFNNAINDSTSSINWRELVKKLTANRAINIHVDQKSGKLKWTREWGICDFWIPDAAGLREIGVMVNDFEMPSREEIARGFDTVPERIYWGKLSELDFSNENICKKRNQK